MIFKILLSLFLNPNSSQSVYFIFFLNDHELYNTRGWPDLLDQYYHIPKCYRFSYSQWVIDYQGITPHPITLFAISYNLKSCAARSSLTLSVANGLCHIHMEFQSSTQICATSAWIFLLENHPSLDNFVPHVHGQCTIPSIVYTANVLCHISMGFHWFWSTSNIDFYWAHNSNLPYMKTGNPKHSLFHT